VTASSSTATRQGQADRPPRVFWVWLTGLTWTMLGAQVLSFGMVWAATAYSAALAGLVLAVVIVPRVVLSLLGGSVADRLGPARVMIISDALMAIIMAVLALILVGQDPGPVLLVIAAGAMGIADAFYLPSSAAIPKFLVPPGALPRAMAARQLATNLTAFAGPVLGGLVISRAGFSLSFAVGAAGFFGMLGILLTMRRHLPTRSAQPSGSNLVEQAREGIRVVSTVPLLRTIVGLTGAFAAFIVPAAPLLIPLLARARGWDVAIAGTAAGTYAAGMATVAVAVMWRHGSQRAGLAAAGGMTLAGAGVAAAALAPSPTILLALTFIAGLGTGLFATHVGPLFISAVPPEYMARAQSVLILIQSLPLLLANPAIGLITEITTIHFVVTIWGAGAIGAGLTALASTALRGARRPT